MKIIWALLLSLCLGSTAFADAACGPSGNAPHPINTGVTPKILKWTARVEQKLDWPAPASKAQGEQLQAFVSTWVDQVPPNTINAYYREAVSHGINAQYEAMMAKLDPRHAKHHWFWANEEADRASACLDLLKIQ